MFGSFVFILVLKVERSCFLRGGGGVRIGTQLILSSLGSYLTVPVVCSIENCSR